jgi:hypothetical protein
MALHGQGIEVGEMAVKKLAAVIGGGAMVALGVVGAFTGGGQAAAPSVVSAPEMSMADTATAAYSATEETSMAVPADKASPPCGFSSSC